jgi:hypothetical protein
MWYKLNWSVGLTMSTELSGHICGKSSFCLILSSLIIFFSFDWSKLYICNIARTVNRDSCSTFLLLQCIHCFCLYLLSEFWSMISIVFGVLL